ncbi:hypothetical protein N7456_002658 [Penicillium angulare]|uniref:Tat pathway signal sequence n=1 Tax=Penicillium angulare TaxID=116970 RepID=A0A9W9G8X1_9EURO|nr:hypothetical protein N7456_002658 [Penicillium angulare]
MYEKDNDSQDYVSSDRNDDDRNSLRASEEEKGFLSGSILEGSQQPLSNDFYRKWAGHLLFTVIWVTSLFAAVIMLRYDGNHVKVDPVNIFDTELLEKFWDPDSPKYTGEPSDELDARWLDLFKVDGVDLHGTEADTIRGQTFEKPGGWSIVGIDVFHQLHCLNMLRQGLRRDYYTEHDEEPAYTVHMNHCLDYLRQAVMCNVDVTPIPVSWDDKEDRPLPDFEMEHTCRNFWKVRDWAIERSAHEHKYKSDDLAQN